MLFPQQGTTLAVRREKSSLYSGNPHLPFGTVSECGRSIGLRFARLAPSHSSK